MPSRLLFITREGWPWLLGSALIALLVHQNFGVVVAWPLWLFVMATAAYFWESDRLIPPSPMGVVAPVDGQVIEVVNEHNELLDVPARRIAIRVTAFASYMLRAVSEGQVTELSPEARARLKGRSATLLHTDEGQDVLMVVEVGTLLGAHPCRTPYGQRVGQGRRCGVRRLARRIDVVVPADSRVDIEPGAVVRGGETVIATLARSQVIAQDTDNAA